MILLFAGKIFYPEGGSQDYRGEFHNVQLAYEWLEENLEEVEEVHEGCISGVWADMVLKADMKSVQYAKILNGQLESWDSVEDYIKENDYGIDEDD
tara:strand:+ start:973 stop:1260 length:288 start_codon:yes stop_codon:yes gene_type:complete